MSDSVHVTESNFREHVLSHPMPTLVDFYADWCFPCQVLAPIVDELSQELKGRLRVAKVNVDQSEALSQEYGILSIPTLVLFVAGSEVARMTGLAAKSDILAALESHVLPTSTASS
ncbi:MAG TPA: thioredoxin [Candidatus Bipolaricaulota bacterium]